MIRLITYSDDRMTESASRLVRTAGQFGAHHARIYGPRNLDEEFKTKMASVLADERGAGWYCWKPYVIKKEMEDCADGDYLIWSDAGTEVMSSIQRLVLAMDDDILLFSNGWRHVEWCKMDLLKYCFTLYNDLDNPAYGSFHQGMVDNAEQVQASHIVFKVCQQTRNFVAHWAHIAEIPHMIDNSDSELPNFPTFQEHRWDQSILCCLQIMYGYKLHWFPTTTAMHLKEKYPADQYPAIFNHHRKRNDEWKK